MRVAELRLELSASSLVVPPEENHQTLVRLLLPVRDENWRYVVAGRQLGLRQFSVRLLEGYICLQFCLQFASCCRHSPITIRCGETF